MERLTHERVNGIKTGYWSAASEAIFKKYNELLDAMIPDEPEPVLSPH